MTINNNNLMGNLKSTINLNDPQFEILKSASYKISMEEAEYKTKQWEAYSKVRAV